MKKTFTLIELLISITIIGVLIGVGIPIYNNYKEESIKKSLDYSIKEVDKYISNFQGSKFKNHYLQSDFLNKNFPLKTPFKELNKYGFYYFLGSYLNISITENQPTSFIVFVTDEQGYPSFCEFNRYKNSPSYLKEPSNDCKKWFPQRIK